VSDAPNDPRRLGRELALQLLFSWDLNHQDATATLMPPDDLAEVPAGARELAVAIHAGFLAQQPAVDAAIDKRLTNWTIGRLAATDRAILRLGAYEILYRAETPPRVAINECVELAKRYGSDGKTTGLVNGVLDRLARDHRPTEVRKRAAKPAEGQAEN
jgi:N utilization substance protein B